MVKVSIIVPVYNAEKTIDLCLKSIVGQSFRDFELIIVNDGSTDEGIKICETYATRDDRVVLVDKENEGSIKARRNGIEISRGEYIMFVDADDWLHNRAVETLYYESINNAMDITVCNCYKVLSNRGILKKKNKSQYFYKDRIYLGDEIRKELTVAYLHGHPFPAGLMAKLYKRDLLFSSGKYLDRITFLGEDLYFNIEVFLKATRVKVLKKALYYYRIGGFTSKYMPYMFQDFVNGYRIQKEIISDYYASTREEEYIGISIMLLNSFKTCLYNFFISNLSETEIKDSIGRYTEDKNILETINNKGAIGYFEKEYLEAIRDKNIDYLYELGRKIYNRRKTRDTIMRISAKLQIV